MPVTSWSTKTNRVAAPRLYHQLSPAGTWRRKTALTNDDQPVRSSHHDFLDSTGVVGSACSLDSTSVATASTPALGLARRGGSPCTARTTRRPRRLCPDDPVAAVVARPGRSRSYRRRPRGKDRRTCLRAHHSSASYTHSPDGCSAR